MSVGPAMVPMRVQPRAISTSVASRSPAVLSTST